MLCFILGDDIRVMECNQSYIVLRCTFSMMSIAFSFITALLGNELVLMC